MERIQHGGRYAPGPRESSLELAVKVTLNLESSEDRDQTSTGSSYSPYHETMSSSSSGNLFDFSTSEREDSSFSQHTSRSVSLVVSNLDGVKFVPEGEWGWMICASAFMVQFIVLGVHNSFGILFTFLLDDFGKSKAATAWIGSSAVGVMYLFGPLTSGLNERMGSKTVAFIGGILCVLAMLLTSFVTDFPKLYVTYSFLWGVGSSFCYFPTLTVPGQYFCRRLSLVNGIVTAGSGIGTLTFGPLLQFLFKRYGLPVTLQILAGVMSLLILASLSYRRFQTPLEQLYNMRKAPSPFIDVKVWSNKAFVTYTLAVSLFMLGYFIPYVHLVSHVVSFGIPASDGALLIGYMSISSTISRILFGKFSDHPYVNRLYMTQFAVVGFGITTTLCPIAHDYQSFAAVMVMLGLFDGMYVVLIAVVITDIVGAHKLNSAVGNLYGVISLAITLGPPLAGLIYDASLSYNTAFYISGATTTLAALLMFLIPWLLPNTPGGGFKRDSVDSRIGSFIASVHSTFNSSDEADDYLAQACSSLNDTGYSSHGLYQNISENSDSRDCSVAGSISSLNTSKNTTFNRFMSHQGSVTKVMLSRQLNSGRSGSPLGRRDAARLPYPLSPLDAPIRKSSAPVSEAQPVFDPSCLLDRRDSDPVPHAHRHSNNKGAPLMYLTRPGSSQRRRDTMIPLRKISRNVTRETTPSHLATTPSTLATTPSTLATKPSTLVTTPSPLATTDFFVRGIAESDQNSEELLKESRV